MKTYVSRARDRKKSSQPRTGGSWRWAELIGLALVTLLLYPAACRVEGNLEAPPEKPSFTQIEEQIKEGKIVALNEVFNAGQIAKVLDPLNGEEKNFAAQIILNYLRDQDFKLANVGGLNSGLRIARERVEGKTNLPVFSERLKQITEDEREARLQRERLLAESVWERLKARGKSLLGMESETPTDFAPFAGTGIIGRIKPSLIVRRPAEFQSTYKFWFWSMVAAFFVIHLIWRVAGFGGDQAFLPIIFLLCGIGFLVLAGMRDPLRDTLSFRDFTIGILTGAAGMVLASLSDRLPVMPWLKTLFKKRSVVPLGLALGLSLILVLFGSGPGTSDAKVNLGPFQPVEVVKILVVFYLAAYFDRHWQFIKYMNQRGIGLFAFLARVRSPRLVFFLPVVIAMGAVLIFFFLQKDLGPALVMAAVFLSLYAVARGKFWLIVGGISILLIGLAGAWWIGQPETVVKRIEIFWDVWENGLRGGDQIAHSLWAMSTGGLTGVGLGLGDTGIIPAGHTDLIISSVGEETGWLGVALVMALYAVLIARSIRAAMRSANDYDFFLALGLALITAWQILLIATGILGLFPLSGVVSPFLSWGKSSMIANFVIMGLILAISSRSAKQPPTDPFKIPVKYLKYVIGGIALLVAARAGYVQVINADDYVLRGALVELRDGSYAFQYNRRLLDAAGILKTGTIYDRNGIPLATSDCQVLKDNATKLAGFGISTDNLCQKTDARQYPFGGRLFHLLGDLNTRRNWGSPSTNYIERDYYSRLRGFDDSAVGESHDIRLTRREIEEARNRQAAESEPYIIDERQNEGVIQDAGTDSSMPFIEGSKPVKTEVDATVAAPAENIAIQPGMATKRVRVVKRNYRDILPLLRYRHQKDHPSVQALLNRERDVHLSIDVRLQLFVSDLLAGKLLKEKVKRGAAVVIEPSTGDVLAIVSYPWPGQPFTPNPPLPGDPPTPPEELVDRAFTALRPPGSTFKIVTAMAALQRTDADFRQQRFECEPLGGGRVGKRIPGFGRPVRDSEGDRAHGNPDLEAAIVESCNAYFAQLGIKIGAESLKQTADGLNIKVAHTRDELNTIDELKKGQNLLMGAYGQGRVVATPFQMARVAATVGNNGMMPQGRWVIDDSNRRHDQPIRMLSTESAGFLLAAMRGVVTRGTAREYASTSMAGKTGTAQVDREYLLFKDGKYGFRDGSGKTVYLDWKPGEPVPEGLKLVKKIEHLNSHAWFIGLAPYDSDRRIAFSVLIENGGYGGRVAAPIAREIVSEAARLGLIR